MRIYTSKKPKEHHQQSMRLVSFPDFRLNLNALVTHTFTDVEYKCFICNSYDKTAIRTVSRKKHEYGNGDYRENATHDRLPSSPSLQAEESLKCCQKRIPYMNDIKHVPKSRSKYG